MKTSTQRGLLYLAALTMLALPVAAGCGSEEPTEPAEVVDARPEDVATLAVGGNWFALDLYGRLAGDGNLFFSPYSISSALGMTAAGARGNTETEMITTLRYPMEETADGGFVYIGRARASAAAAALDETHTADPETDGHELHIANSLWGQDGYPFLRSYLDFVESYYGAGFNLADFVGNAEAERVRINEWVEVETREKIVDLIPPGGVDAVTTLVLTNAVYFKGQWDSRFEEKNTREGTFHGFSGDADVPLMFQKAKFKYFADETVQFIEMPYVGDEVSMVVALPRVDNGVDLPMLEGRMTVQALDEVTASMREEEVRVYFPKFEMTWGTADISRHLSELGMKDAFTARADFTGMSELHDLFIGPVFHKAFVAVDEEGTEAAAATAVVMKRLAIEHETIFRADHPFMFLIRHNETGSILFMGRVADLG